MKQTDHMLVLVKPDGHTYMLVYEEPLPVDVAIRAIVRWSRNVELSFDKRDTVMLWTVISAKAE